jgi:hypothetical protein
MDERRVGDHNKIREGDDTSLFDWPGIDTRECHHRRAAPLAP